MGTEFVDMYNAQPAATNTTLYTCAANTRVRILKATATNDTTTVTYISFHIVPTGGSVSDANIIINRKTIGSREAKALWELEGHVLEAADLISAIAETASIITVHISGMAIT